MARTHQIPVADDPTQVGRDLTNGKAVLVTTIIPEENEDRLIENGLVTRLSYNRVLYPNIVREAGWTIQFMGQMGEHTYRYAHVEPT